MKKIIVLTSGGDAPGMNAAIRAVVRTCHYYNIEPYGCQLGYQGLINRNIFPMSPNSVGNCIQMGGTILKAARSKEFFQKSVRDKCREFLANENIDGLVIIGGNGSIQAAAALFEEGGPPVITIPGSIDNDIPNTEYSIGFDTACNTALDAIDKVRDTASSHNRNFLVEVMGRTSGFIAAQVGIAGGAEFILIPEYPIQNSELAQKILGPRRDKKSLIIVVAEAGSPGRSLKIAEELSSLTGQDFRVCILGHTQRGGSPTSYDRKIASIMGYHAVKALVAGDTNKMVAIQNNKISLLPLPAKDCPPRTVTDYKILEMNEILCR